MATSSTMKNFSAFGYPRPVAAMAKTQRPSNRSVNSAYCRSDIVSCETMSFRLCEKSKYLQGSYLPSLVDDDSLVFDLAQGTKRSSRHCGLPAAVRPRHLVSAQLTPRKVALTGARNCQAANR